MRGVLSFVVLHSCSQAKCFDLSRTTTWCPPPKPCASPRPPPFSFLLPHLPPGRALTHDILIYLWKGSQGFAWSSSSSSLLLIFQLLSAANRCHCHYPPAEHTAVVVAEPGLIHSLFLLFISPQSAGSALWTKFTELQ